MREENKQKGFFEEGKSFDLGWEQMSITNSIQNLEYNLSSLQSKCDDEKLICAQLRKERKSAEVEGRKKYIAELEKYIKNIESMILDRKAE